MRMGSIYEKARSVCAWLGPAAEDSDDAIGVIKQVLTPSGCESVLQYVKTKGGNKEISFAKWQALALLMARPWFSRRWVIQEVAFAAELMLQCGNTIISWSEFSRAVKFLGSHGREIAQVLQSTSRQGLSGPTNLHRPGDLTAQQASRLLPASTKAIQKDPTSGSIQRLLNLHDLLSLFPDFEASDRRDVVYALIPLAKDAFDSKEWRPDYSKDYVEVWKQYVGYVARQTGSLDVLCQPWAPPSAGPGMPWWISSSLLERTSKPGSLVRPATATGGVLFVGRVGSLRYRAGGDSLATFTISGAVLFAMGIFVDRIAAVGGIASRGKIPMEWRAMAIRNRRPPRQQSQAEQYVLPEEFCDTLVAGRNGSGGPPLPSFYRACDHFFGPSGGGDFVDTTSKLLRDADPRIPDAAEFLDRVRSSTGKRRFVITKERRMGLVPARSQSNDMICILLGCTVPVVLRQAGANFRFLGESYVNDLMKGEAISGIATGLFALQEFQII
jgi:hypothetical protein